MAKNQWNSYIKKQVLKEKGSVCFSNESLMHEIVDNPVSLDPLFDCDAHLTCILYIRNPLDHVFSAYGQQVKRFGCTKRIGEWINSYNTLDRVLKFIDICEKRCIHLKIINYSKINSVENSFVEVLFDQDAPNFMREAKVQATGRVNRSLSRFE